MGLFSIFCVEAPTASAVPRPVHLAYNGCFRLRGASAAGSSASTTSPASRQRKISTARIG